MSDRMGEKGLRARLTVRTERSLIRAVTRFVGEVALAEGLTPREAGRAEVITEEACLNVMEHAFEGDTGQYFDIVLERRPARFVIAVEDRGLPFDWTKARDGEKAGFGILLMKAFADEIRHVNLGKGGKRLEMVTHLSYGSPEEDAGAQEQGEMAEELLTADIPIDVRLMAPDEGVSLARCMYRAYGYDYRGFIYYPEKVREVIAGGLQESIVAVTPDGEIVAHQALVRAAPEDRIAEMGQGVVDTRCRGRRLFERVKAFAADHARSRGYYGLYTETVTIHPYSQKANLAVGARETGILLGYGPPLTFRKIADARRDRQTVVIFYHRTNPEPERVVYPPLQHRRMIQRIYEHGGFARTLADAFAARDLAEGGESALIDVDVMAEWGFGFFRISRFGRDLQDLVRVRLRELCLNRIECIYIDLPLSDPFTPAACSALEVLGFSFVGIIPEMRNGDILRLQYLNNVPVDPSLVVVSDFGRDLLHSVLEARQVQAVSAGSYR